LLDILDQVWQVGFGKADPGRWNPVVLDVGVNVLVMGMGAGEVGNMGMLKGIVPGDLLVCLVDLVAIVENASSLKVDEFPGIQ